MTLYDNVISNLRGVLGSRRDGVFIDSLDFEYESMSGEHIPLRELGYNTLYDFIIYHHELFRLEGSGRYCKVVNVVGREENETTLDLINLVKNTHIKSKKKRNDYIKPFKRTPSYRPSYPSKYQNNNQTNLYHGNFKEKFPHSNSFSNFSRPYDSELNITHDDPKVTIKHLGFNRYPIIEVAPSQSPNLASPTKFFMGTKEQVKNKSAFSIDDDMNVFYASEIATQTPSKELKARKRLFYTFQYLDFVHIIIDIIIQVGQINCSNIIKIKINGDLYNHFLLLTGLNMDPELFYDFVLTSIDSPNVQCIYYDLINLDPSKSYCILSLDSYYETKGCLPHFQFDEVKEYVVEIVKKIQDNFIAFKISDKFNVNLRWEKSKIRSSAKNIIERQHFWSWFPGSYCLVQLPYFVITSFNLLSVERAVIISTEIAMLNDDNIQNTQAFIIHRTSFYLVDHDTQIDNILSCASSYEKVKMKAKEKNNSRVAFVCNMSFGAINTPSKLQFTKLENYNDTSHSFLDGDRCLRPNILIVLKNLKKTTTVINFQSIYSCYSKVHEVAIDQINGIFHKKQVDKDNDDDRVYEEDIIVISDDDENIDKKSIPGVNTEPIKYQSQTNDLCSSYIPKTITSITFDTTKPFISKMMEIKTPSKDNVQNKNDTGPHYSAEPIKYQSETNDICSSRILKTVTSCTSDTAKRIEIKTTSKENVQNKNFAQPHYSTESPKYQSQTKDLCSSYIPKTTASNSSDTMTPMEIKTTSKDNVHIATKPLPLFKNDKISFKLDPPVMNSTIDMSRQKNQVMESRASYADKVSFKIPATKPLAENVNWRRNELLESVPCNKLVKIGHTSATLRNSTSLSENMSPKIPLSESKIEDNAAFCAIKKSRNHADNLSPTMTSYENTVSHLVTDESVNDSENLFQVINDSKSKVKDNVERCTLDNSLNPIENASQKISCSVNKVKNDVVLCLTSNSGDPLVHDLSTTGKSSDDSYSLISLSSSCSSEKDIYGTFTVSKTSKESLNDVAIFESAISYFENNVNSSKKFFKPLSTEMIKFFDGRLVKVLHLQEGSAVVMILDSVKLMKRDVKMKALKTQPLRKVERVRAADFYIWSKHKDIPGLLVEILHIISKETVLINIVHEGLLAVVNIFELFYLPEDKNNDAYENIRNFLGPMVGTFRLHMLPDWFTPDNDLIHSTDLFTAHFVDDNMLVLEYFEQPCKFLNIEIIASIEKSLTVNHCNTKSTQFIKELSKDLLQCRFHVGNILEMLLSEDNSFDSLPIAKCLRKVTMKDKNVVCFASIETKSVDGHRKKLSPHNFMTDQFCVDRVTYDSKRHVLKLMEAHDIYITVPCNFEGIYTFHKTDVDGPLKTHEEFFNRYMLVGATEIPDLKYLFNKLIF